MLDHANKYSSGSRLDSKLFQIPNTIQDSPPVISYPWNLDPKKCIVMKKSFAEITMLICYKDSASRFRFVALVVTEWNLSVKICCSYNWFRYQKESCSCVFSPILHLGVCLVKKKKFTVPRIDFTTIILWQFYVKDTAEERLVYAA